MRNKFFIFLVLLIAFSINITRAQQIPTAFPVGFNPIAHATVSGTQSICAGQPAQITINFTGGGTIWRIIWNDGVTQHVVTNITTNPYVLTLYPSQTTAYWVDSVSNEYLCPSTGTGVALVTVNQLPQIFNLSATNPHFCEGGVGDTLLLSGSEVGVNYQLKSGLTNVGLPVNGTGAVIKFIGITLAGAPLNVIATNQTTLCSRPMNGTVSLIQDPLPLAAGTISGSSAICTEEQTTYSVGAIPNATSYEWTIPTGMSFISGQNTQSIIVKGVSAQINGSIIVRGKNACNYGPPSSMAVVINQKPSAQILTSDTNICSGTFANLLATGGTALWNTGATSPTIQVSPPVGNNNQYNVIITSNGCKDTAYVSINVMQTPTIGVSFTPTTPICSGTNVHLTATGADFYSWNPGGTGATITQTPPVGTTTYTVTGTSANGCSNTATINVLVHANPVAVITSDPINASICSGQGVILTAGPIAIGNSYNWNIGGNSSTNPQNPINNGNITTTVNYAVTVTDTYGCSGNAAITVTVNPNPVVSAASNSPICSAGGVIHLNGSSSIGGTYSWTGPAGYTSSAQNPTISNPGTWMNGTYSLTVTTGNGCIGSSSTILHVNNPPTLNIAASDSILCAGYPLLLIALSDSGSINWTDGFGWSSNYDPNPTVSNPHTGDYTATAVYGGCTVYKNKYILVNPLPTVVFNTPGTGYFQNTDPQILLSGSPAGGVFSGMGVFNSYFYPVVAGNGTWVLTYEYTDGNGCTNSATQTVIVGSTGVDENAASQISLYPNPVTDVLNINTGDLRIAVIQLYDAVGKLINSFSGGTSSIDFSGLSAGVYFVQFTTKDGQNIRPFKVMK